MLLVFNTTKLWLYHDICALKQSEKKTNDSYPVIKIVIANLFWLYQDICALKQRMLCQKRKQMTVTQLSNIVIVNLIWLYQDICALKQRKLCQKRKPITVIQLSNIAIINLFAVDKSALRGSARSAGRRFKVVIYRRYCIYIDTVYTQIDFLSFLLT